MCPFTLCLAAFYSAIGILSDSFAVWIYIKMSTPIPEWRAILNRRLRYVKKCPVS